MEFDFKNLSTLFSLILIALSTSTFSLTTPKVIKTELNSREWATHFQNKLNQLRFQNLQSNITPSENSRQRLGNLKAESDSHNNCTSRCTNFIYSGPFNLLFQFPPPVYNRFTFLSPLNPIGYQEITNRSYSQKRINLLSKVNSKILTHDYNYKVEPQKIGPESNYFGIIGDFNIENTDSLEDLRKDIFIPPSFETDISSESRFVPKNFVAPRPLKNSPVITTLSNSGWTKRQIDSWDSSRNKIYSFKTPNEVNRQIYWEYLLKVVQLDDAYYPKPNNNEADDPLATNDKESDMIHSVSPILKLPDTQQYFEWKTLNRIGAKACRDIPTPQRKLEAWRQQNNLIEFYKMAFDDSISKSDIPKEFLDQYIMDEASSVIVLRDGIVDTKLSRNISSEQNTTSEVFYGSATSLTIPEDRYFINEQLYWIPEYSNYYKVNSQQFHRGQIGSTSRKYDNDVPVYDYRKLDFGMAKFTALNQAGLKDTGIIIINPNVTIDKPIQILEISTTKDDNKASYGKVSHPLTNPRTIIWLKSGSSAHIQQTHISYGFGPSTVNSVTRLVLEENAHLKHHYVQELSNQTWHWENISLNNGKHGHYDFKSIQIGAKSSRVNLQVEGNESSEQQILSLGLPNNTQTMSSYQMFHHEHPNMTTEQKFKYLLADKGQGLWRGRVRIETGGLGAKATTLCRAVLLNQGVECITIPTLEIIQKDVQQASHGAAISDLEEEPIFFLRTRGIDESIARYILMKAFTEEVSDDFKDTKLKSRIAKKLKRMVPKHISNAAKRYEN